MTWVILLGSAAMAVWVVSGGFLLTSLLLSVFAVIFLGGFWFLTRPLWRQGHGARLRPMRSVPIVPFKSAEHLASAPR